MTQFRHQAAYSFVIAVIAKEKLIDKSLKICISGIKVLTLHRKNAVCLRRCPAFCSK